MLRYSLRLAIIGLHVVEYLCYHLHQGTSAVQNTEYSYPVQRIMLPHVGMVVWAPAATPFVNSPSLSRI